MGSNLVIAACLPAFLATCESVNQPDDNAANFTQNQTVKSQTLKTSPMKVATQSKERTKAEAQQDQTAKPQTQRTGYMVIAGGSKEKAKAQAQLEQYKEKGYPRHDDYPKLVNSTDISGLNPGFWIVVAATSQDQEVAKELNRFLRALGVGSYIRKVQVEEPEDLRLVVIKRSEAIFKPGPGWKDRTLARGKTDDFKLHENGPTIPTPLRGKTVATDKGYAVIPYVPRWQGSSLDLYCNPIKEFTERWETTHGLPLQCWPRKGRFEGTVKRIFEIPRLECNCVEPELPP